MKINPQSEPIPSSDPQPGDISMRAVVEEFLQADDEDAVPEAMEPEAMEPEAVEPESPEEPPPAEPLNPA